MNTYDSSSSITRRLVYLFAIAYFGQAVGQLGGLIGQPLNYLLKSGFAMQPAEVAGFQFVVTIPWLIKPIYGLISDCFPIFGYRRKSWLLLVSLCSSAAFFTLSLLSDRNAVLIAIFFASLCVASGDVIVDAVMVEKGQMLEQTAKFQSTQWLWFNIANVFTAIGGGYLCYRFTPVEAIQVAALIACCAPVLIGLAGLLFLSEERNLPRISASLALLQLWRGLRQSSLLVVALFLLIWNCSPSFGIAFYFHMSDKLLFEQSFIGNLGAVSAIGSIVGAWLYGFVLSKLSISAQLLLAISFRIIAALSYLPLAHPSQYAAGIAIALNFCFAITGMAGSLSVLTLAAQACPKNIEGLAFALLMSIVSGFGQLSAIWGANLFQLFDRELQPVVIAFVCGTAACFLLTPFFINGIKTQLNEN